MVVIVILVVVVAINRKKSFTARCSARQAVLVPLSCRIPSRPSKLSWQACLL